MCIRGYIASQSNFKNCKWFLITVIIVVYQIKAVFLPLLINYIFFNLN